jgi:hypothetical protein
MTNQDNETKSKPAAPVSDNPKPRLEVVELPFDAASGPRYQWQLKAGDAVVAIGPQTYPDNWTACQAAGEVASVILQSLATSYVMLARQVADVQAHAARKLDAAAAKAAAEEGGE